jgi:WD40 repeat protein
VRFKLPLAVCLFVAGPHSLSLKLGADPPAAKFPSASAEPPTWNRDVEPLLRKHCTVCHNDASLGDLDTSGGLSLESIAAILKGAGAPAASAGKPGESPLVIRLSHADPEKRMPKDDDPLSGAQIDLVRRWVAAGLPAGAAVSTASTRRRSTIRPTASITIPLERRVTPTDFPPGTLAAGLAGPLELSANLPVPSSVTSIAFSPDGRWLAVGMLRRIVVWDRRTARIQATLTEPVGPVLGLAFTADGRSLWSAGGEPGSSGEVRRWQVPEFRRNFAWTDGRDAIAALAVSTVAGRVATLGFDRQLRLFDAETGALRGNARAHSDAATALAFSPDGRKLVTGGRDSVVKLWSVEPLAAERTLAGHPTEVVAVGFGSEGRMIYSASLEPLLRKWNLTNPSPRMENAGGTGGLLAALVPSPDGRQLASVGADRVVRLWAAESGNQIRQFPVLPGEPLYAVAFAPDGKSVAAGGWDGMVTLLEIGGGRTLARLIATEDEAGQSLGLAVRPNGLFAADRAVSGRLRWSVGGKPAPALGERLSDPAAVSRTLRNQPDPTPPPTTAPSRPKKA